MKSNEIIVPRMLVKYHFPHPEPYGESMVELINGMVTDVYTNDKGQLFSITSEDDLIEYLRNNIVEDLKIVLYQDIIVLRSVNFDDVIQLMTWMNKMTSYSFNSFKYSEEDIRVFVSHTLTNFSHEFIIEKNEIAVGLAGFSITNEIGNIDLKIYDKNLMTDDVDVDKVLHLLMDYIVNTHNILSFSTVVFEDDSYSIDIFKRNKFIRNDRNIISYPISEFDTKNGIEFEYSNELKNSN